MLSEPIVLAPVHHYRRHRHYLHYRHSHRLRIVTGSIIVTGTGRTSTSTVHVIVIVVTIRPPSSPLSPSVTRVRNDRRKDNGPGTSDDEPLYDVEGPVVTRCPTGPSLSRKEVEG